MTNKWQCNDGETIKHQRLKTLTASNNSNIELISTESRVPRLEQNNDFLWTDKNKFLKKANNEELFRAF